MKYFIFVLMLLMASGVSGADRLYDVLVRGVRAKHGNSTKYALLCTGASLSWQKQVLDGARWTPQAEFSHYHGYFKARGVDVCDYVQGYS